MATSKDYSDNEDDNWMKDVKDADVFVMYNNDDEYEISKYIFSIFEENNVNFVSPEQHIRPGYRTYQAIDQAIEASKKMLLILSKESIDNFSFSLETLLALEKSLLTNKLSLIILLKDGLKEEDVSKLPILRYASHVILESNMHEKCIGKVIDMIRADVTMDAMLPAGNLAAGMAWSHFTGFLEIVLNELANGIKKSEWFNNNPGHMPVCLFMLLPYSGRGTGKLGDDDPDVEEVGQIDIIINNRNYSPKVCKVTERDKNGQIKSEYYCVAQYPGAFCALGTIQQEIISSLPKQEREVEVQRFYHYLGEILNHDKYKQYGSLARMLMYNDEDKSEEASVSYQLRKGIHEVIKEHLGNPADGTIKQNIAEGFREEVCLLYHKDDEKIVFKTKDFLDAHKVRYSMARPQTEGEKGGDSLHQIESRVREARWVLLFITEKTKRDNMISMFLAELLSIGIESNLLKVIPILKDVSPTKLPSFIKWAMHISIDNEKDYLNMILNAIKGHIILTSSQPIFTQDNSSLFPALWRRGREITMQSQIPIGNVAYGLAWAFFVNYLRYVLPDLRERIEICMNTEQIRKYRENSRRNVVVSSQLWEIVPKSCRFQVKLSDVDANIEGPWRVQDIERRLHGTKRVFPCNLWKISTKDTDYYFAGEYLTPVKTLYNMHISMIAGLSYDQMMLQRKDMIDQLKGILNTTSRRSEYEEKCGIIEFDDTATGKETLSSNLINMINKETGHKKDHDALLRLLSKDDKLQNES